MRFIRFSKTLLFINKFLNHRAMMNDLREMVTKFPNLFGHEQDGEKEWLNKWRKLDNKVSPYSYRIYSYFIGKDMNILPCDVSRNYVEPILNPENTQGFYSDKNSLGLLVGAEDMPKTLFRSINYTYYDSEYETVKKSGFHECFNGYDKLIVKSATGLGGYSVRLFKRDGGDFYDNKGNKLTLSHLESIYATNFLIQECFVQSEYMSQFNPTSVNTIRMNTYRDVETGEIRILGAVLRIGPKGSVVDNASSGGVFIGIDDNGNLLKSCFYFRGAKVEKFNDIDFSKQNFTIPNYDNIKKFAIKITKKFPHMSLFAHDIALDKDNNPKIIEVNVENFTYDFLQSTKCGVFGEYTDSVIDYCISKQNRITAKICKNLF